MLKYLNYDIVFQEIPDETTLAINLTNCPNKCKGCHSPELQEDIGEELNWRIILDLVQQYPKITCICFMGGDNNISELYKLCESLSMGFCFESINIKLAWYSGKNKLPKDFIINEEVIKYIKLGPYIEEAGPLNNPNTNQRLYKVENGELIDITYKFWK